MRERDRKKERVEMKKRESERESDRKRGHVIELQKVFLKNEKKI